MLRLKKRDLCISFFSVLFLLFALPQLAFASTLSLSPSGGNIYLGATKTVSVALSTGGEAVNGFSAYLSYPADKLDVAWVSAGAAFAIEAEKSYGGGIIKISRGNVTGVKGRVNVATIAFKGKSAGQATVSFIGGSSAPRASDSSDSLNLGGSTGAVFTVGGSAPPVAPKPSGSKETAEGSLVISDLKIDSVSSNSAVISWKTQDDANTLVDYGLDAGKYFLNASNPILTKDHVIKLENPLFVPGLTLHFKVTSKTESSSASSEDIILQLPGYNVKVKVTNSVGQSVAGANVTLYSYPMQGVTDQSGEISFQNVMPGKHVLLIKGKGIDASSEVEVKESSSTSLPQVLAVSVKVSKSFLPESVIKSPFFYIGVALVFLAVVVSVFLLRRKPNSTKTPLDPSQKGGLV